MEKLRELTLNDLYQDVDNVNWDDLAEDFMKNRTGMECRIRWFNYDDPKLNRNAWNSEDDKELYRIAHQNNLENWVKIAEEFGKNRVPSQVFYALSKKFKSILFENQLVIGGR